METFKTNVSVNMDTINSQNPELVKCCKNCRHFCPYVYEFDTASHDITSDYGECRRFPPKAVPAEECGFPVVHEQSWCGEFDI